MVILKDGVLKFHPDTLENVRKDVNLEKEERIEEAVDILENWVKKQRHFTKKDFSREYLERTLITTKGLVERAKQRLDKLCTFKTLMPNLYPKTVRKSDFERIHSIICHADLPLMTKEHYRVYMLKLTSNNFDSKDINAYYRYMSVLFEYLTRYDYNNGTVVILDYTDVNILNFVAKCTPLELRQMVTLATEGYSIRIKQIHVITPSKMIDMLVTLFKQVLSAKLGERIHLHKSVDTLYDFVGKDILPIEYGGKEKSLKELNEMWLDALTSKDFVEYYEDMCKANTDESYRQSEKFTEQYIGMPGSFRALSVD